VHGTERSKEHPEEALDRAVRGHASPVDAAALDEHLSTCDACAAQLAIASSLEARVSPGPRDEALNRAAVHRALTQLAEGAARARAPWPWRGLGARLVAGGAALTVAAALTLWRADRRAPPGPQPSTAPAPLVLEDGSEIVPSDAIAAVQVAEKTPTRTLVRLHAGGARFRIRHDARRLFQVDAGAVEIEDLGTDFRVLHEREGRVRVSVSEGRVAVIYGSSRLRVELGAGEERTFAPAISPPPAPPPAAARLAMAAPVSADDVSRTGRHPSPGDGAADLLATADLARRSGRPEAAVAPLRRLVRHHAADPRAPSAAFTLGWVLLMDLGRPREAALAFEQAERMAPQSALSEDATARAAQAWQKAGVPGRAGEAAQRYARLYPTGRYAAMMRGLTGER